MLLQVTVTLQLFLAALQTSFEGDCTTSKHIKHTFGYVLPRHALIQNAKNRYRDTRLQPLNNRLVVTGVRKITQKRNTDFG